MSALQPTPDWLEAQKELVRLQGRIAELEKHGAKRKRGQLRAAIRRHVERWASTWGKQAAGLVAQREDACKWLWAAVSRSVETDDQILLGRVREALAIMGSKEGECYMISIAELYESLERDWAVNGRKTVRNLKAIWERHLKAVFAHVPAHGLSRDAVMTYIAGRQKEGAANATINRELAALRRMLNLAIEEEKLRSMPKIRALKERNVRKGFVRESQYPALARATAAIGLWLRSMFELGYTYGWRKSELLNMRVRQVDLNERTIVLEAGTTKNDDPRLVEMTDRVFELLRQCVAGKDPDDRVFTRPCDLQGRRRSLSGTTGYINDFRDGWSQACAAAGCQGIRFHDLRRSAVRNMIRAGIPQKVAQTISGHRTAAVFARYQIIDPSDLREAVRKLQGASAALRLAVDQQQQEMFPEEAIKPKTLAEDRGEQAPKKAPSSVQTPEQRKKQARKAANARWAK